MSAFTKFALFAAGLALVPAVSAFRTPVGSSPSGNAIHTPTLDEIVPAGKPYSITWNPTTRNCSTLDIVLLHGPATNAVPLQTIALNATNSGSYTWTPSTKLAPQKVGYGLELICDATGTYQYSDQFGISNADYVSSSSTSSSSSASVKVVYATDVLTAYTTYCPYATSVTMGNKTYTVTEATSLTITDCPCTVTSPVSLADAFANSKTTLSMVPSAGYQPWNSSLVHPTGAVTVPASLKSTATVTSVAGAVAASASTTGASAVAPPSTGAAGHVVASFGGMVVAAGLVLLAL